MTGGRTTPRGGGPRAGGRSASDRYTSESPLSATWRPAVWERAVLVGLAPAGDEGEAPSEARTTA